jgi:hypothetical protein
MCMVISEQRDTSNANETEMYNVIISWERVRTKDPNVRMEIIDCQKTDYRDHKL